VLRKGLEQLELLVRGATGSDLAPLRSRLEAALRNRPRDTGAATRPQDLQVSEASRSLFDEMERGWTGKMPLEEAPAPAKRGT
jgi:hypothetical protein